MSCPSCGDRSKPPPGTGIRLRSFLFYFSPDSPYQKINPLTKLVVMVTVSTVAFIIENIYANLILLLVVCMGLAFAHISFGSFKKVIIAISGLLLIAALTHAFFSQIPDDIVYFNFPWGSYITERTIHYVTIFYLKFLAASLANLIFLCTTRETDLIVALRFLRLPYILCFMFALTLRLMSILLDDWWALIQAQRARGMDFEGSIIERLKKLQQIIFPLLTSTFKKIENTNYAILARGFTLSNVQRTRIRQLRWRFFDHFLLTLSIALLVVVIVAKYYYGYLSFR